MARQKSEFTGIFIREKARRDQWCVLITRPADRSQLIAAGVRPGQPEVCCVGNCDPEDITAQCEYRFYGLWEDNTYGGVTTKQFKFTDFVRATPHSREGVIRYLTEAPNIGLATANALWAKFGADAVRICRESPDVAVAALAAGSGSTRFSLEKAEEAAAHFRELQALENVTIELTDLLAGRGFPKGLARECIRTWGSRAPWVIQHNPYALMRFRGCGFLKTDKMYLSLGLPAAKLKRQALCTWHAAASDSEGHTWHPISKAESHIKASVGGTEVQEVKAVSLARRHGIIVTRRDEEGRLWFAEGKKARQEEYIARKVAEAMLEEAEWPRINPAAEGERGPTAHQAGELTKATAGMIGILAGAPGTGKTYTTAVLVREIIREHGTGSVAVCAPTGKAAVRLSEAMSGYGIQLTATTIHRLLRVTSVDDGWTFAYGEYNPLPFRFIIADEQSMTDVPLMSSLIAARGKGTHLLLVGDPHQLPPVGHGAPLRDFIAAKLPYGELREIKRNAGTIVRACAAIRDGQPIPIDEQLDPDNADDPKNLKLIPASRESAPSKVMELVRKLRGGNLADPIWDVQIIVAVNAKSNMSRKALNPLLQEELNPNGKTIPGTPFRESDKVMQTRNAFLKLVDPDTDAEPNEKGEVFVANGEFGKVIEVHEKKTVVEFSNPTRRVAIPRGRDEADEDGDGGDRESGSGTGKSSGGGSGDLVLGFASTCHKSQGAEFPIVIVALDEYPGASGPYGVAKSEWLFTAISRAKRVCFLVGKRSTAGIICRETALDKRKTFLRELIDYYFHARWPSSGGLRAIFARAESGDRLALPLDADSKESLYFVVTENMEVRVTLSSLDERRRVATIHANADWTPAPDCPEHVIAAIQRLDDEPEGALAGNYLQFSYRSSREQYPTEDDGGEHPRWSELSKDELARYAKEHAANTGECCFCGLVLKNPASVFYGYGPWCARKHGLPYDPAAGREPPTNCPWCGEPHEGGPENCAAVTAATSVENSSMEDLF